MSFFKKIRVGVLRGGPFPEYDVSLKTGASIIRNLPEPYLPVDIFIDKKGTWHVSGVVTPPQKIFRQVDVIFDALHGEHNDITHLLDAFGVPHTGSGRLSSVFAQHKGNAKKLLARRGIKTPVHKLIKKSDAEKIGPHRLWQTVPNPSIVKPAASGSSLGITVARDVFSFEKALAQAFAHSDTALIEEFISGREATCAVIEGFRGQTLYPMLPVEVVLPSGAVFFDYNAKYGEGGRAIHPGRFSVMEKEAIQNTARVAHETLGLRHYSRSDFIVSPKRGVYFLEINHEPELSADGEFAGSLAAVGSSLSEFISHVLGLALAGK